MTQESTALSRIQRFISRKTLTRALLVSAVSMVALAAIAGDRQADQPTPKAAALLNSFAGTQNGAAMKAQGVQNYTSNVQLLPPEAGVIANAAVERDAATRQIRRVRGLVAVAGAATAREAAERFLQAHRTALELSANLAELRFVREVNSLTGTHLTYAQVYGGLEVFGGQLSVHTDRKFAVRLVNHDLIPIPQLLPVQPPNNAAAAIQAALQAVQAPSGPTVPPVATAGVLVQKGAPTVVWRVTFDTTKPPADWEVMVNANTLQVITLRNLACYVDGSGMIFNPEPITTSGNAMLMNSNNTDVPALLAEEQSATLQGLDGSGRLTGIYASTAPSTSITRALEPSLVFNYTRSDSRFDEVMAYYHADAVERKIQSLGFTNIENRQIGMNVNGIPDTNAFYAPSTQQITLGRGTPNGNIHAAQDAEVIWHENGHAIQFNQVPGWGATEEGGSMGEGFGDYWAGSAFAGFGPRAPDWDVFAFKWFGQVFTPASSGNPPYLRRLVSTKHYPENVDGEVHDDGEMWSASLWQIRGIVGQVRADTTILEAHFSLSPSANFRDGCNAILATNQALYGGADQTAIQQVFIDRGFLQPVNQPTGLTATVLSPTQVGLAWTSHSTNEQGFQVERKVGSGAFALLDTTGPGVVTYTDNTASPNTTYTYRVRGFNAQGFSLYSNQAIVTTPNQTYTVRGTVTGTSGLSGVSVQATGMATITGSQSVAPNLAIPDNDPVGVTSTIAVPATGTLSGLRVGVNITHTYIGDLKVTLIHPDGTQVILHNRTGGSTHNLTTSYPDLTAPAQSLAVLNGKPINGTWKLFVQDLAAIDVGTLDSWSLTLTYTGTVTQTATTGADGTYTFSNLPASTYTVTPQTPALTYTPPNRTVTVGPDQSGQDFTATATVAGTVTLQGCVSTAVPLQPITFTFRPAGGTAFVRTVNLAADGSFSLSGIPAGPYALAIKGAKWLQKVVSIDTSTGNLSGVTATLLAGDVTNHNAVTTADYLALKAAFGSQQGDPNYNPGADLNCDGTVSTADYLLLKANFGQVGDP